MAARAAAPPRRAGRQAPITIGASLSLTGKPSDFSADGQAFEKGYELWAKDVNAHGGLLGRKVKLTILDDASTPNQVVSNYQTLIGADHVDLAFGPFSSLLTAPAVLGGVPVRLAFVEGAGGAPSVFDTPSNQADHNVFDVSLPVADEMIPFVNWIASLPANAAAEDGGLPDGPGPVRRPARAARPDRTAETRRAIRSTPRSFPRRSRTTRAPADQVAATDAQLVVLGSTDVPTVAAFMQAFEQKHYRPKMFIAAAGPDQGSAFTSVVGRPGNADGMMVPDGWYPGSPTRPASRWSGSTSLSTAAARPA